MKFLIPTAKELALKTTHSVTAASPQARPIISLMSQMTVDDLATLYRISRPAAIKEAERWQQLAAHTAPTAPAMELFNGLMYRQIDRKDLTYLSSHVLITSALYGVIGAAMPIAEHRLDFQQRLTIDGQSLKAYWRPIYDQAVAGEDLLISLLSSEFEEVFSPSVQERFIKISFHEEQAGQLKTHSTISKKGRGLLLNQAQKDQVQTLDQLTGLTFAGFAYRADLSTAHRLVYVRCIEEG